MKLYFSLHVLSYCWCNLLCIGGTWAKSQISDQPKDKMSASCLLHVDHRRMEIHER